MSKQTILYLRTEVFCNNKKLIAGGSVAHTVGVIQGFIDHNYDVLVASTVMLEQLEQFVVKRLLELTLPKPIYYLRWKLTSFVSSFFFLKKTYTFTKKHSIAFIYQRYSILNCTGVLLSYFKNIPLILEYNGSELWVDKFWSSKKLITFRWLIYLIELLNIKYAHTVVVVSQPLKDDLVHRGINPHKILVNPNGVNTKVLDPFLLEEERVRIREQLGIADKFVFGFIGTFNKWHGIELLVAMIAPVIKQKPHAHFLLIGDGPLFSYGYNALNEYIRTGHVTFTGIIAQQEAKKYLAACDAFLSPTLPNPDGTPFFGSPTKIFEYLSMGKPIIASELNQVAEIINPAVKINDIITAISITNQVGITITPGNIQELIKAVLLLMEFDKGEHEKMGLNARTKAIQEHDWNHHVQKIIVSTKNESLCY